MGCVQSPRVGICVQSLRVGMKGRWMIGENESITSISTPA